jgi:hypothetical protein
LLVFTRLFQSCAPFWAEGIQQLQESCVPFLPNVLKVFLENGQTKSFKYDSSTTVKDVLESLQQKMAVRCPEHFSLVVEHVKALRKNKLTVLDPQESLARVSAATTNEWLIARSLTSTCNKKKKRNEVMFN